MRLETAAPAAKGPPALGFGHWPRRHPDRAALERLADVAPFDLLDGDEMEALLGVAAVCHNTEAATLFTARAPAEYLHVAMRGQVVLHGPDGVIIDGVAAPAILDAADLFTGRHVFTAEAMTGSLVVRIPRADMLALLRSSGPLAHAFLGLVAAASQTLADALLAQRCLTSVQRLATFLLEQAARAGAEHSFVLDIPKKAIAGQLGITPAHFARSLTRLVSAGLVGRLNRNTIVLNDISALRALLEGELGIATQDGSTAQHRQLAAYRTFKSLS